jgi:hypothetical protein
MADLNQFLNKDLDADDVLHSNGYANVAGGGGAGGLSMDQRRNLARKEVRVVGDYRQSQLGSRMAGSKARTADQNRGRVYDPNSDNFDDSARTTNRDNAAIKDRGKIDQSSIDRRQHFIEPSARPAPRGYDKFA